MDVQTPEEPTADAVRAVRDWCSRVRLNHWAHFLALPLATFDPQGAFLDAVWAAGRGVASAFSILAFGYLLNSVSDRQMDLDVRKNPFVTSAATEHRYSLAALLTASVALAIFSPWPAQLATFACLSFGVIYSTGPRIKSISIVGSLANLGNFCPLLFVGMRTASLPPQFGYVAVVFATMLLQNQLIHEAGDTDEDRRGGVRTTWRTLGPQWTALLAAGLGLIATFAATRLVPAMRATPLWLAVGAVYAAAFPLLLAWRGVDPPWAARLRIAHRWCAVLFGAGLFAAWRWAA